MFSSMYNQTIFSNEDYIYHHSIKHNRLWEEETCILISDLLEDNTDFLDIGANIGLISIGVKRLIDENRIHTFHCFEPNNEIFCMLKKNTEKHDDIILYNMAVGEKISLCNMSFNPYNNGASYVNKILNEKEEITFIENGAENINQHQIFIPTIPIDLLLEFKIFKRRVSVVKMDIEGFEYEAILGMRKFFKQHKPNLIIEIFSEKYEEVDKLLVDIGFHLVERLDHQDYLYSF